jgi:hypothetical protein
MGLIFDLHIYYIFNDLQMTSSQKRRQVCLRTYFWVYPMNMHMIPIRSYFGVYYFIEGSLILYFEQFVPRELSKVNLSTFALKHPYQ